VISGAWAYFGRLIVGPATGGIVALLLSRVLKTGGQYPIVPELLFRVAERAPPACAWISCTRPWTRPRSPPPRFWRGFEHYACRLTELLPSWNVAPTAVVGATITIDFDLRRRRAQYHPPAEVPEFSCTVELTDDRGRAHYGGPENWWRK